MPIEAMEPGNGVLEVIAKSEVDACQSTGFGEAVANNAIATFLAIKS